METIEEVMMRYIISIFVVLLLLLGAGGTVLAQHSLTIEWEVDDAPEGGWTIGDSIHLKLIATSSSDIDISLPELPSQWGPFEVSDQKLPESIENNDGTATVIREATVIPWETGELMPPAVRIQFRDSSDTIQERVVPVLSIQVGSVLTESDTQKRDLKPQASLSLPGPAIWPWILGTAVFLVFMAVVVWWIIRHRRQRDEDKIEDLVPVDDRYPEVIAYEKLDRLVALDLPAKGEFTRHYDMVTDCVRSYLEGIYKIPAMERTTPEIMTSIRKLNEAKSNEIAPSLHSLLEEADLIKFAKLSPTVERAGSATRCARSIVDVTRPDRDAVSEDVPLPVIESPGESNHSV